MPDRTRFSEQPNGYNIKEMDDYVSQLIAEYELRCNEKLDLEIKYNNLYKAFKGVMEENERLAKLFQSANAPGGANAGAAAYLGQAGGEAENNAGVRSPSPLFGSYIPQTPISPQYVNPPDLAQGARQLAGGANSAPTLPEMPLFSGGALPDEPSLKQEVPLFEAKALPFGFIGVSFEPLLPLAGLPFEETRFEQGGFQSAPPAQDRAPAYFGAGQLAGQPQQFVNLAQVVGNQSVGAENQAARIVNKPQMVENQAAWNVNGQPMVENQAAWNVNGQPMAENQAAWNINEQPVVENQTAWNVSGQPMVENQAAWNINEQPMAENQAAWNVNEPQQVENQAVWNVNEPQKIENEAAWNVDEPPVLENEAAWNVNEQPVVENQAPWNVNEPQRVENQLPSRGNDTQRAPSEPIWESSPAQPIWSGSQTQAMGNQEWQPDNRVGYARNQPDGQVGSNRNQPENQVGNNRNQPSNQIIYSGNQIQRNQTQIRQTQGDQTQIRQTQGDQIQRNQTQRRQTQGNQTQRNQTQISQTQGNQTQRNQAQRSQTQENPTQRNQAQRVENQAPQGGGNQSRQVGGQRLPAKRTDANSSGQQGQTAPPVQNIAAARPQARKPIAALLFRPGSVTAEASRPQAKEPVKSQPTRSQPTRPTDRAMEQMWNMDLEPPQQREEQPAQNQPEERTTILSVVRQLTKNKNEDR